MKHIVHLRLLSSALALFASAAVAQAQLTNIDLDISLFGNLSMSNSGPINCGPTAKANSLAYLQRKYEITLVPQQTRDLFPKDGKPDDWNEDGKVDFYDDLLSIADLLSGSDYMNVNLGDSGCTIENFIYGQDQYLKGKGISYKGRISKDWNSSRMEKPDSITDGKFPDLPYLHGLLSGGYDVELLIDDEWNSEGHYLTLTSLHPSDNKIGFIDPRSGLQQIADIKSTNNDQLTFTYEYTKLNTTNRVSVDVRVHAAVAEIPEPLCFALLGLGSLVLVLVRRR